MTTTQEKHLRNRTVSISVTQEEYDFIYETGSLVEMSVSSWGRDLLVAEAFRVRRRLQ